METTPPNPQAFPLDAGSSLQRGMSLRDYFATAVMQGLTAKYGETLPAKYGETLQASYDSRAKESYKMADAMLKAREL